MTDCALIFGVNSPVAAALSGKLIRNGFEVHGIYHQNVACIPNGVHVFKMDALEQFNQSITHLFIVGAYVPRGRYNEPSAKFITTNIDDVSLLCRKFPDARVVFCSSVSVYGEYPEIISESSPYMNPSLYGLSKLAGETIIRQAKSYAICRFTSIYGANLEPNNFVNRCIHQARTENEITLWGSGAREQNYLFLEDAADWLIAAACSHYSDIFLCTSNESVSNKRIAEIISVELNVPIRYSDTDNSPSCYFNNKLSSQRLNYYCSTTIDRGINACLTI